MNNIPIPYSDETARPGDPGRVLYAGGAWQVPENERPANWQEREKPKADGSGFVPRFSGPKIAARVSAPPKALGAPEYRAPGPGRPRILFSEDQRRAARTEKRRKYRARLRSARPPGKCLDCGNPTGRAPNAKRCEPCASGRSHH